MALRFIDKYAGRVQAKSLLANPHPAAVDYLIEMLHSKKMTREFAIDNWFTWMIHRDEWPTTDTDMVRFGQALQLSPDEKEHIATLIMHDVFVRDDVEFGKHAYLLFGEYFHLLPDDPDDDQFDYSKCALIAALGTDDNSATEDVIRMMWQQNRVSDDTHLIGGLLNSSPNELVVDYLLKFPNKIMLDIGNIMDNPNIRIIRFVRDNILCAPGGIEAFILNTYDEDQYDVVECKYNLWWGILSLRWNRWVDVDDELSNIVQGLVRDVLPTYPIPYGQDPFFDISNYTQFIQKNDLIFAKFKEAKMKNQYNPFLKDDMTRCDWNIFSANPHLFDYDYDAMRKKRHAKIAYFDRFGNVSANMSIGEAIQSRVFRPPYIAPRDNKLESRDKYRRRHTRIMIRWNRRLQELGHNPVLEADEDWVKNDAASVIQRWYSFRNKSNRKRKFEENM